MKSALSVAIILVTSLACMSGTVGLDDDPPTINMTTEFPIVAYEGMQVFVLADVLDVSDIQLVTVGYEIDGESFVEPMGNVEGYVYQWMYQNDDIGGREELVVNIVNVTAYDVHTNWAAEFYDNSTITVKKEDVEGPVIEPEAIPLYTESKDHMVIRASVTDPSEVGWVKLHVETDGQWSTVEMLRNNVTLLYEAIVGPFETDTPVRYYIEAIDRSAKENTASTLDYEDGYMYSFVASFRKRFDDVVVDSSYMQVDALHRYQMTSSQDTIEYEGYIFNLRLSDTGVLTGNVTRRLDGEDVLLQGISLQEKSNVLIVDQETKDGIVYDFNLKYISYNPEEPYAEIEINPRQKLVFEGYSILTSIRKVSGDRSFTFEDGDGGKWQVNVTVESGYQSTTKTFTSENQFQELFLGSKRDIQIFFLGDQQLSQDQLVFGARMRVYKFQPPIFDVVSDVPTGSPSGLSEGQIVYNVYADDDLTQVVTARNTAGSRAYDIDLTFTNVSGYGFLVIYQGDLTSSEGPVYTEKEVGGDTVRYYLTHGTLARSFYLNFSSNIQVRESATFDLLLSFTDAHGDSHEERIPVQFLIYPSRSELEVSKRLTRDPLFIGKESQASIIVENTGGSPALEVTVVDNTPPNLISDFETWTGRIKSGESKSITYSIKPTTITVPGQASYGFVTVYWKGVCHKSGVRNDAYTLHTEDFYFEALGPHLNFESFEADREIVEENGQEMIFINVGERVTVSATVKNEGNRLAKNISLSFPEFTVESTDFPTGTQVDVGQYFSFTATVVATKEGTYPFQAKITHQDEHAILENVYETFSNYVLAQTYLSPVVVHYIDPPSAVSVGEIETISISIRNIGNSPVEDAQVLLDLSSGLKLEWGEYLAWEGTLLGQQNEILNIQVSGQDFGPNSITAVASGRDIPEVEYVLDIEVLSPRIEATREIDCEYLLAREEYWQRSGEIISWVTLSLQNTGNDNATNVIISETLPEGILSLDNLTFGSNLIVWGEVEAISLPPNGSVEFTYPIWSHDVGHYVYEETVVMYTNPQQRSYESRSNTNEVWVLGSRPFLVPEGQVQVLDTSGEELDVVSYNDTAVFVLDVTNIGNQNATGLDLGSWLTGELDGIDAVVRNVEEIQALLNEAVDPGESIQIPIEASIMEDVGANTLYHLDFHLGYLDGDGRSYATTMDTYLEARPTQVVVSFYKWLAREHVAPGETPKLHIQVTNDGDTDITEIVPSVSSPEGMEVSSITGLDLLRESETGTMTVEFSPVSPSEGEVYESYRGFAVKLSYRTYRGLESTDYDGVHLELSVAEPFLEVTRSITSSKLLARHDDWPFSDDLTEYVTITIDNTADIAARDVVVDEELPDGLYTSQEFGNGSMSWGGNGTLVLDPGEVVSFTYPVWSFEEGLYTFGDTAVSYTDGENHNFGSYSEGLKQVETIISRPYVVWEGDVTIEPAGSITYNDTVTLRLGMKNIGNSGTASLSLQGWNPAEMEDGWELLNPDQIEGTLSSGLNAGSSGEIQIRLRLIKDVLILEDRYMSFDLGYTDDSGNEYSVATTASVLARPATFAISTDVSENHYLLMPNEPGYVNLTVKNIGDTDLFDLDLIAECPEDVEVLGTHGVSVVREGESCNLSIAFSGYDLEEESVGRLLSGINLTVAYTDYRDDVHTKSLGGFNLSVVKPKVTFRQIDAKPNTRLGRNYEILIRIANDGTYPARDVRIDVGSMAAWAGGIEVQGGTLDGTAVLLAGDLESLSEAELVVSGKVEQKGEFTLVPTLTYADRIGSPYEAVPDPISVKSGERLIKLIMPFLLWAGVAAGIGGIYYYETRIAEKIKGHQLGSLASSVITQVEATGSVPPLIPHRDKKLSLAEFSLLLSQYVSRVSDSGVKKADKTTFIISHPQSRLVPGQDFRNLIVVRDAYLLVADMIQNRVKSSEIVPPTFLVQGFKLGLSDIVTMLSMVTVGARKNEDLPRSVRLEASTRVSAGRVRRAKEEEAEEEARPLVSTPETTNDPDEQPLDTEEVTETESEAEESGE
jgi:uncharacterized repeat protein (TIGR01451 family)